MPEETTTEIVEKATEEVAKTAAETKEEVVEKKTSDPKSDERTANALKILETLEDPEKGLAFITELAKQAGILKAETPREEKKAEKVLSQKIKEALGDDLSFMQDKMEAVANAILEEMRPSIQRVSQETEAQLLNARIEKFQLQHDVTEAELEAMNKLTEKVLPAPKVSLEDHLDTLLGMVRAKTPKTSASSKTKIAENFQRKPASTGIEGNEERVKETTKPSVKSGQEAVEEALRKLQAIES